MRFSFLTIVVTLTAAMSVKACYPEGHICNNNDDCCIDDGIYCDLVVSMRNLLCIQ